MQFCQPTSSLPLGIPPTGFPNYGQPYNAFNTPNAYQFNEYPEIIGEGNVTTVFSPDGSTQLLFIPTAQWWRPHLPNPNIGNYNNHGLNYLGAWFVRNICNPLQPVTSQQYHQTLGGLQYPRATSDYCLNLPTPSFPVKFHNDNCTSTTDLHYFTPKHDWFQKTQTCAANTAVQVDIQPIPYKGCPCLHKYAPCTTKNKQKHQCNCNKEYSSISDMSVDESHSDMICRKMSNGNKANTIEKAKQKKSKSRAITALDKCVTTYADKASCCEPEHHHRTQTVCGGSQHQRKSRCLEDSETEIWTPKTPVSKKAMDSSKSFRIRTSGYSSECNSSCSEKE